MIDLHTHVMYGWDDGAPTSEDSLAMMRVAAEDGIRVMAATPHMLWQGDPVGVDDIVTKVAHLNEMAAADGLDLRIVVGTEMPGIWDALMPLKHKQLLTLDNSRTVLFETPFNQLPVRFPDLVFQVRMAGFVPLLAHPERSAPFLADRDLFLSMVDEDMPVQITAGSLTGTFGERTQDFAWEIVRGNWPIVISSDAHNVNRRPPVMSEARAALAEELGEEAAELMCNTNAAALLKNQPPRVANPPRALVSEKPSFGSRLKRAFGRG